MIILSSIDLTSTGDRSEFDTVNYWQERIKRWDSERKRFYDDIAQVVKNTIKENLLRLTNFTIARQVLCIKSWIYESPTDFPTCSYRIFIPWASRGPSADVYYRHSNRKLSIVWQPPYVHPSRSGPCSSLILPSLAVTVCEAVVDNWFSQDSGTRTDSQSSRLL